MLCCAVLLCCYKIFRKYEVYSTTTLGLLFLCSHHYVIGPLIKRKEKRFVQERKREREREVAGEGDAARNRTKGDTTTCYHGPLKG